MGKGRPFTHRLIVRPDMSCLLEGKLPAKWKRWLLTKLFGWRIIELYVKTETE